MAACRCSLACGGFGDTGFESLSTFCGRLSFLWDLAGEVSFTVIAGTSPEEDFDRFDGDRLIVPQGV